MAKLTIVPKLAAGTVSMDAIPAEFITEFEEAWAALQGQNGAGELRVEFDDEAERNSWLTMARSYGEQRVLSNGDADRLRVRATPKRGLPKTVAFVAITRDLPATGEANHGK